MCGLHLTCLNTNWGSKYCARTDEGVSVSRWDPAWEELFRDCSICCIYGIWRFSEFIRSLLPTHYVFFLFINLYFRQDVMLNHGISKWRMRVGVWNGSSRFLAERCKFLWCSGDSIFFPLTLFISDSYLQTQTHTTHTIFGRANPPQAGRFYSDMETKSIRLWSCRLNQIQAE